MDFITGKEVAKLRGARNYREFIREALRGKVDFQLGGLKVSGSPVYARVDFSRWLADCPTCNGAEYVDPEDPVFYCCSCHNRQNNGEALPVVFPSPEERAEIESALLERPIKSKGGPDRMAELMAQEPLLPGCARSWNPGETVEQLREQAKKAKEEKEAREQPNQPKDKEL